MANVLSAELLTAQDNASRYPLVEIKAGQFADDLPLAGQRLNRKAGPDRCRECSSFQRSPDFGLYAG